MPTTVTRQKPYEVIEKMEDSQKSAYAVQLYHEIKRLLDNKVAAQIFCYRLNQKKAYILFTPSAIHYHDMQARPMMSSERAAIAKAYQDCIHLSANEAAARIHDNGMTTSQKVHATIMGNNFSPLLSEETVLQRFQLIAERAAKMGTASVVENKSSLFAQKSPLSPPLSSNQKNEP
ncbi:MAG TPA: hypothetical protein VNC84_00540 [Gammaproteobacteria bacterium]|jgi:hypothetical protein|nr:hypothetical protein [Gammaproteobacteria bacterium]